MKTLLLLSLLLAVVPATGAEKYLLRDVHVIDPAKKEVWTGSLLIEGGKVHRMAKAPKKFAGQKAPKELAVSGMWVLPGLSDMHDHSTLNNPGPGGVMQTLTTREVGARMLYSGVTSFLDLMADERQIFDERRAQRAHAWTGATLYAAGPMLTCTRGHGTEFGDSWSRTMDNPAQAKKQVAELARKKPDVIKLAYDHARDYLAMDKATMQAVIAEAKHRHLKTIVHIGTWQDAREAVEAGATVITHLHETPIPDDLPKLMASHGTWEIPTLTYQCDLLEILENRSLLNAKLLQEVTTPQLIASYRKLDPNESYVARELAIQVKGRQSFPAAVRKLADAGVRLMVGTDSGDLGVFQGYSVHREMALLVKAGLSPWQALAAGTTAPKAFLGKPSGIADGQSADFVVLSASPVSDITNTQTVEMVFHDGKLFDQSARAALLSTKPAK